MEMYRRMIVGGFVALAVCSMSARTVATESAKLDFQRRVASIGAEKPCFEIFKHDLTAEQRGALEFLYAYMPWPDVTDYTGEFYLMNVDASLRAMDEMPWGKVVPEREFRHFVLPPRVNNENLDSCRVVFYEALKERVRNLSMADAILEVNHWCHERVSYQPSDARTSSPLATIKSAVGRCGEESTFTVAALRAVGIPARQVYTPRWAHTDDNHAWVEAWADGKWYFLGACEPEAVLTLGWFNAPASRGMMMNTKVFGRYDGPEEVLDVSACYTAINVTSNYTPVDEVTVRVINADGTPAVGSDVSFCLYNYAEYFPVATKRADEVGQASLTAGRGDLMIWASDGKHFGMRKCSVGRDSLLTVILDKSSVANFAAEWDLVPPPQSASLPDVPKEVQMRNDALKVREDSMRMAYINTFFNEQTATEWAEKYGFDVDKMKKLLPSARGNHAVITSFLLSLPQNMRERGLRLLSVIAEKDRRDITPEVLNDFMKTPETSSLLHDMYVLNPRITSEGLTTYRSYFASVFDEAQTKQYRKNPEFLVKAIANRVRVESVWNPQNLKMNPVKVWEYGVADVDSRNHLFVAAARSVGIPARIDPVSGNTQYADANEEWHNVKFGDVQKSVKETNGSVEMWYAQDGYLEDPGYYIHFTLSEISGAKPRLMEYPDVTTCNTTFASPQEVTSGQYMLTSGQRMADGSVLARSHVFTIAPGETTTIPLVMRNDTTGVEVIGNFNSELTYHDDATDTDKTLLSTSGRGYYVLALMAPGEEPTTHALRDLALCADELQQWQRAIFLVTCKDKSSAASIDAMKREAKLSANVVYGADVTGEIGAALESVSYPVVIVADTFNRVVFRSEGYTINLGTRLTSLLSKLK